MNQLICEELKKAIISDDSLPIETAADILSPIFKDSLSMSEILIDILESIPCVYDDELALPEKYDLYVENFYTTLQAALDNGLNPNEIVPYENEDGGDNIMWAVVGNIRHSSISPKTIKTLLEYGGDPNTRLDAFDTVFSFVDDFFWIHGEENLSENLLRCWLLMAVYGGDQDNIDFLPLKPLNNHKLDELKDYEKYSFSFETVESNVYKRTRVLFIIDTLTGEKVAVNETPFG